MEQIINTLEAVARPGIDAKDAVTADVVSYSHIEINGVVHACLIVIDADGGVWIYPEKKLYNNIRHEVYARLNEVEYQEYLEMDDYAEARYPEPTTADLQRFFAEFRSEFMPLRSITLPTRKPAPSFASNAEVLGTVFACSPSPSKS